MANDLTHKTRTSHFPHSNRKDLNTMTMIEPVKNEKTPQVKNIRSRLAKLNLSDDEFSNLFK